MNRTFFKSLAELVLITYGASFFGLLAADGFDYLSLAAWKAAALAAAPAAVAVIYGAFARLVGNFGSALVVDTRQRPVPGAESDVQ